MEFEAKPMHSKNIKSKHKKQITSNTEIILEETNSFHELELVILSV